MSDLDDLSDDEPIDDADDPVVAYVDGGMDDAARRAFEVELERSEPLRQRVKTARIVRGLVSGLARAKPALPPVEALFERLDAEPAPALGRLLRAIPRAQVPASLRDRVFRKIPAFTPQRIRAMPPGAWVRLAAAAALLIMCGIALQRDRSSTIQAGPYGVTHGRPITPTKGPYRFQFTRDTQSTLPGFNASALPRFPASVRADGSPGDRR